MITKYGFRVLSWFMLPDVNEHSSSFRNLMVLLNVLHHKKTICSEPLPMDVYFRCTGPSQTEVQFQDIAIVLNYYACHWLHIIFQVRRVPD